MVILVVGTASQWEVVGALFEFLSGKFGRQGFSSKKLSWKSPGHVLGMGKCPKVSSTESDGQPYFVHFSFTCLQHVLADSCGSSLPPGTKKLEIN